MQMPGMGSRRFPLSDIVAFPVEASTPPEPRPSSDRDGTVVALPNIDLDTVIEMVECLREIGSYRTDQTRAARLKDAAVTKHAV